MNAKHQCRTIDKPAPQAQCNQTLPAPPEAAVLEHARQLDGYLAELQCNLQQIDERLFGPKPTMDRNEAGPGLNAKLDDMGTRAACLVSQARTILERLGE
jgi:hypothetical protein